jgi:hypothetical protein
MDCYCDHGPSFCNIETVRARKPHRCYECARIIPPREEYERTKGIWEGEWATFKICHLCAALRKYVTDNVPCFCWMYGSMRGDAMEELKGYAHELPGLWFGGARLYVKANHLRRKYANRKTA